MTLYPWWIPNKKKDFVMLLNEGYPIDLQGNKIDWNKYSLEQLRAIYLDFRERKARKTQTPKQLELF